MDPVELTPLSPHEAARGRAGVARRRGAPRASLHGATAAAQAPRAWRSRLRLLTPLGTSTSTIMQALAQARALSQALVAAQACRAVHIPRATSAGVLNWPCKWVRAPPLAALPIPRWRRPSWPPPPQLPLRRRHGPSPPTATPPAAEAPQGNKWVHWCMCMCICVCGRVRAYVCVCALALVCEKAVRRKYSSVVVLSSCTSITPNGRTLLLANNVT